MRYYRIFDVAYVFLISLIITYTDTTLVLGADIHSATPVIKDENDALKVDVVNSELLNDVPATGLNPNIITSDEGNRKNKNWWMSDITLKGVEVVCASAATGVLPALVVLFIPARPLSVCDDTKVKRGEASEVVLVSKISRMMKFYPLLLRFMIAMSAGAVLGDVVFHSLPDLTSLASNVKRMKVLETAADESLSASFVPLFFAGDYPIAPSCTDVVHYLATLVQKLVEVFLAVVAHMFDPLQLFALGIAFYFFVDRCFRNRCCSFSHCHNVPSQLKKSHRKLNVKDKTPSEEATGHPVLTSSILLVLISDTAHNFTDGLLIGSAFLCGHREGWKTTFAIAIHEIPHELGDYALLLRAGWSRKHAFLLQIFTAIGNLGGVLFIIMLNPSKELVAGVLTPFVSGTFVYLALVCLLGELLKTNPEPVSNGYQEVSLSIEGQKREVEDKYDSVIVVGGEIISLLFGLWTMHAIKLLEGSFFSDIES
eukprot:Tbor_TRINITY_DN4643_c0_g1::TRINITY_DN4643_c0_g1_i1::g.14892::m.14892/K14713/SLC39A7, KE4, ZIP7; solute carrier family 39 (zinc transporter), member 7